MVYFEDESSPDALRLLADFPEITLQKESRNWHNGRNFGKFYPVLNYLDGSGQRLKKDGLFFDDCEDVDAVIRKASEFRPLNKRGYEPKHYNWFVKSRKYKAQVEAGEVRVIGTGYIKAVAFPDGDLRLHDGNGLELIAAQDQTLVFIHEGRPIGYYPNGRTVASLPRMSLMEARQYVAAIDHERAMQQAPQPDEDAIAPALSYAESPRQANLTQMRPPPWVAAASRDMEATTYHIAVETLHRSWPRLLGALTPEAQFVAIQNGLAEVLQEFADAAS